jgi:CheY-like chemotaxis protein
MGMETTLTPSTLPHCPTVLVVEDDPNDRFFVMRAFRKASAPVHLQFAVDGHDAIAYLSGSGRYQDRRGFPLPALMLLDLKMPNLSGFGVLQWLRAQEGLKRLPVTILSSSELQEDIDRAYELGANAYVVKPFQADEVQKAYNRAVEFFTIDAETPVLS